LREQKATVDRGNARMRLLALTGILAVVLAVGIMMRLVA
jgi:hypothetical protein